MVKRLPENLHHVVIIVAVIISAILSVLSIVLLIVNKTNASVCCFGVSYILVMAALVYLFKMHHTMDKREVITQKEKVTFSRIANSLAADYDSVFYVNMDDNSYVEYGMKDVVDDGLAVLSSGADFFKDANVNVKDTLYPADQEKILREMSPEKLKETWKNNEIKRYDYRILKDGKILYYNLKITQGVGEDSRYIIIGTRNVDAETRAELSNIEDR